LLVVLSLKIFDVDRSNFSDTVISTGEAPAPIKEASEAQDASEIRY